MNSVLENGDEEVLMLALHKVRDAVGGIDGVTQQATVNVHTLHTRVPLKATTPRSSSTTSLIGSLQNCGMVWGRGGAMTEYLREAAADLAFRDQSFKGNACQFP